MPDGVRKGERHRFHTRVRDMSKTRILIFGVLVLLLVANVVAQVSISKPIAPPAQFKAEPPESQPPLTMPAVAPDKVVLTVGDIKITSAQFDALIEGIPEAYRTAARTTGRKPFAENLVKMLVLAQEGKRLRLNETEKFKAQEEFQTMNHIAAVAFAEINDHAKPDDAALQAYYNEHKAEFEQVHLRHILVRTAGSVAPMRPGEKELTDAEAEAKAIALRKRLLDGADFAQLAASESDDADSASRGGELDAFGHGQTVPSFDKAAFALQVGVISEPIRTPFGYHLIRVDERTAKPLSEVKTELEKRLRPEAAKETVDTLQKKAAVMFDPEFFQVPDERETNASAIVPVQR